MNATLVPPPIRIRPTFSTWNLIGLLIATTPTLGPVILFNAVHNAADPFELAGLAINIRLHGWPHVPENMLKPCRSKPKLLIPRPFEGASRTCTMTPLFYIAGSVVI